MRETRFGVWRKVIASICLVILSLLFLAAILAGVLIIREADSAPVRMETAFSLEGVDYSNWKAERFEFTGAKLIYYLGENKSYPLSLGRNFEIGQPDNRLVAPDYSIKSFQVRDSDKLIITWEKDVSSTKTKGWMVMLIVGSLSLALIITLINKIKSIKKQVKRPE